MRLSWRIGRVAGINLYVHATFLFVFLFVGGGAQAVESVLLILSVFGCVLLHELGHALMARRFGIQTEDITLYPIGGVARLRRLPRAPGAELLIALAGPAVNFAIAGAIASLGLVGLASLGSPWSPGTFLEDLLFINLGLALFNLIPAFPMDGGRVLRALLSGWIGRARATRYAAAVGRGLALVFGLVGLFVTHNMIHVALAAFIYFAARSEEAQVLYEERQRAGANGDDRGIWVAPPGYRWVHRGGGIWQLAPAGVSFADSPRGAAPWR